MIANKISLETIRKIADEFKGYKVAVSNLPAQHVHIESVTNRECGPGFYETLHFLIYDIDKCELEVTDSLFADFTSKALVEARILEEAQPGPRSKHTFECQLTVYIPECTYTTKQTKRRRKS